MKQILSIIIVILIGLSLSACFGKNIKVDKNYNSHFENDYYEETIDSTSSYRRYFSYEGYKLFPWAKANKNVFFLDYKTIQQFGDFSGCEITLYDDPESRPSFFRYNLIDATGYEYTLTVQPRTELEYSFGTPSQMDDADMRTNYSGGSDTYVTIGDIKYKYTSGGLMYITWRTKSYDVVVSYPVPVFDNITFEKIDYYTEYSNLADYNMESGTFLSKLLNADTAEQAAEELTKKIERRLAWNRFMAKATVPLIITGIVLLALISFLVIRKNVLRQKAKEKVMSLESDSLQNDPPADSNESTPPDAATDNIS